MEKSFEELIDKTIVLVKETTVLARINSETNADLAAQVSATKTKIAEINAELHHRLTLKDAILIACIVSSTISAVVGILLKFAG